jgi:hypothetical protein
MLSFKGVCEHRLLFTHCYAGEVGSTHDAQVLRRSDAWSYINQRNEIMFPEDTHIVGDKAYPCLPQLITPFRNNGHLNERNFNYRLSVVRSCIERAFALLKKRCRCLKDNLDVRCNYWLCKYIMACCVLDLNVEDIEDENGEYFNEDIIILMG